MKGSKEMLKTLSKSIRQYKLVSILTPLLIAIEVVMESFIVYTIKDLINLMQNADTEVGPVARIINTLAANMTSAQASANEILLIKVIMYGVTLIIMALISLACGVGNGITGAKASAGFAANLREDTFNKIQDFSFENIDSFQTSSLVTRLTTDVSNVQMAYQMLLRIAIRCPLQIIFSVTLAFNINTDLSWLFVIIIPFIIVGLAIIIKLSMPIFTRLFKRYDAMNNSVQENIKGIRVVKSYVREDYEIERFNKTSDSLASSFTKVERILAFNGPLMQLCIHVAILLISYFGAYTICTKTNIFGSSFRGMNVGDLQALIAYGIQMLGGLQMLSMIFVMLSMSYECAKRICEVLNTKSTLTNPENPIYEIKNGDIRFENVNFKYDLKAEKNALYGINLDIKSGMTVGIIGGTGSAKTTLVNLISRLYDVTDGAIYVGDVDVRKYDLETLRNNVAVVLQKNVLFSGTIAENLRWGNKDASMEELVHATKLAQAYDFIESFPQKFETHIEQGGTNVSGGQKQRLCIARALLKNPKILILDDSTSAVDTKTDALIRKGLKEFIPTTTKIIIAQRISSVMEADMIVVLDNGTINGLGTHEELLKNNAIYQEVYYTQNKVGEENAKNE